MDCHEPEMRDPGLEHEVDRAVLLKPFGKLLYLVAHSVGRGSLVMDTLPADRTRHHLHRAFRIVAPSPYPDL